MSFNTGSAAVGICNCKIPSLQPLKFLFVKSVFENFVFNSGIEYDLTRTSVLWKLTFFVEKQFYSSVHVIISRIKWNFSTPTLFLFLALLTEACAHTNRFKTVLKSILITKKGKW